MEQVGKHTLSTGSLCSEYQLFNAITPPPPFRLKRRHLIKNPDRAASAKREEDRAIQRLSERERGREGAGEIKERR